jgi:hypothetical protein
VSIAGDTGLIVGVDTPPGQAYHRDLRCPRARRIAAAGRCHHGEACPGCWSGRARKPRSSPRRIRANNQEARGFFGSSDVFTTADAWTGLVMSPSLFIQLAKLCHWLTLIAPNPDGFFSSGAVA